MKNIPAYIHKIMRAPRVRMVLVGAVSVGLAYAMFLLLIVLDVHYLIASVANFVTYWLLNFFLNKHWAFKSRGNSRQEALAHVALHLGNQLMIMVGLFVLVEYVGLPASWSQLLLQAIAMVTVFIITPIIFKPK